MNGFCVESIIKNTESIKDISIHFGVIKRGYGWVFPRKDELVIGYGSNKKDKKQMIKDFTAYTDLVGAYVNNKRGAFIPYGNYVKTPCKDNIILVGDAAGLVDPLTGEGLYFSFKSSILASNSVIRFIY